LALRASSVTSGSAAGCDRRSIDVPTALYTKLVSRRPLASTLAYSDLLYQAMQVNSITFRPLEVYTFVAGIFFITLLALSVLAHLLESRLSRASYQTAR